MALTLAGEPWLGASEVESPVPVAEQAITDFGQFWNLSADQKSRVHPLRLEGRVNYFDPRWRHLWLQRDEVVSYLPLSSSPPLLRQGQRVLIEGTIIPNKGLDGKTVTVRVLQEDEPIEPLRPVDICDLGAYTSRIVKVQGYVDSQQLLNDDHLRLSLVVDDQPVTAWVKPRDPRAVPDWRGRFVQLTGLYAAKFDPTGTQLTIELWTGREEDLVVTGSLADLPGFHLPTTPIHDIYKLPRGASVRIRGRVQASEPGASLVVRDETGQVTVQSVQQQRMAFGSEVEVTGTLSLNGARWSLRSAFYRLAEVRPRPEARPALLDSAERVRQLSLAEAAKGLPVRFAGVVTWSLPGTESFFVEDLTGGVRVRYRPGQIEAPPRNKYLRIEGVTYNSGFAPAVELSRFEDLGAMETSRVREITLEQALTGQEDGQLVEIRGFFQRTETDRNTRRIHLATPAGEFIALLESPVNFSPTPGSLVRIRGVCEAITGENGRVTGVMLRVGSLASFMIEANAPADFFDLPLRSVKDLRQLNTAGEMLRVRIAGVVLHAVPGRSVYLQDGDVGLVLLTHETTPLMPGDRIEAVGILGWEGVRTELRETVCRRLRAGPPPLPVPLAEPARLVSALDARLVRVRGTLIDVVTLPERTRFTLQADGTLFEAVLDRPSRAVDERALRHGAILDLSGLYQLGFDDLRRSRDFQLQLRSPEDIVVFRAARVWTVARALTVVGILSGCTLLGLIWVVALRRRVRRQTAQIREQLERQARLETEMQRVARLESLGVLGGGIAHDFNNILTVIMGNLGVALADVKLAPTTYQHLQEIGRAAARARQLTRRLLTFAKGGEPVLASVALDRIVSETVNLTLQGSAVCGEFEAEAGLWPARADKDQIAQVMQNLVQNAIQAMPDGGTLRVALANDTLSAESASPLTPGRYLRVMLVDSGEGIPPDVLPKIFDPYFSTRPTGSGLGLATAHSIVNRHQGRIAVESQPGRGTTVTLWLPVADAAAAPPVASASPFAAVRESPAKTARILLMDDEESIRLIGTIVLRRSGFETVAVADGAAAVTEFRAAQAAKKPFDLLILDLTILGGMGGRETIAEIRKLDAAVPAIVSSGYSSDPVMANYASYGFQGTVPKPYEVTQLLAVIEQLLGRAK